MATTIKIIDGRAQCSACGCSGKLGASCDVCWRIAHDREIARVIGAEFEAVRVYGGKCDVVTMLRRLRDEMLDAQAGHSVLRAIFPGARMQAPEPP